MPYRLADSWLARGYRRRTSSRSFWPVAPVAWLRPVAWLKVTRSRPYIAVVAEFGQGFQGFIKISALLIGKTLRAGSGRRSTLPSLDRRAGRCLPAVHLRRDHWRP
jgi:hypothetical protein